MPEHPSRPDRPGPWARRRAALAAAALAVAGLVVGSFTLVARDSAGQVPRSAVVPPGGPTTVPVPTIGTSLSTRRTTRAGVDQPRETAPGSECQSGVPSTVSVGTARELQRALDRAVKGQRIRLADGVYQGEFVLRRSGTASRRIALCGSRKAVLRGDTLKEGYVLHLDGAKHWTLSGFSVTNGEKGIMADRAADNVIQDIDVHHIGHEGIHLRAFSTGNLVQGNLVHDTGLRKAKYGEGVYVGSAHSNWCEHSGCKPDRSDGNRILDNRIGPDVTAEGVDLKEGTTSGLVSGNDFIGRNMTGADSWVDVKGNAWTVKGNRGHLTPRTASRSTSRRPAGAGTTRSPGTPATWAPTASTASGSTTTPAAPGSAATTGSAGPARGCPTSPAASRKHTPDRRDTKHEGFGHRCRARRAGHGGVPGPHRP